MILSVLCIRLWNLPRMEVYIIVAFVFGPCQRSMHAIRGVNLPLPLRFPAGPAERTHENALALERNLLSKLETTIFTLRTSERFEHPVLLANG